MYRHLPNLISSARLLAGPVLLWLAVTRQETAFSALLIAALVSDVADGLVARIFRLQSKLGAMLDSIADVMTLSIAACGIWMFHPDMYREHAIAGAAVIGSWVVVCVVALLRYGRLSSFHTYLAKATGYALGFFLAALFVIGFVPWLFYPMVALSVIGSIEELALIRCLPDWRADVRGLWWVLRERKRPDNT
jgi:CDP-diacylglycerol--glycerol-3-phosphate 3-phosphatidyltransferase